MNKTDALAAVERYMALLPDFGFPNQQALREAERIVSNLRAGPLQDCHFLEKLHSMQEWASIGFSTRKFARYAGGASQVRRFALGDAHVACDLIVEHWDK